MNPPLTLPKNKTRQRKLLLLASRNCRREAERRNVAPERAADLLSWADAFDFHITYRPEQP